LRWQGDGIERPVIEAQANAATFFANAKDGGVVGGGSGLNNTVLEPLIDVVVNDRNVRRGDRELLSEDRVRIGEVDFVGDERASAKIINVPRNNVLEFR
jgi:hypothetical protein